MGEDRPGPARPGPGPLSPRSRAPGRRPGLPGGAEAEAEAEAAAALSAGRGVMGDEKAQRVRNLLSSYYGLAEGAEEGPAKSGPVSELDQPVFDAPRYMSGLLRKLPLPELMDRHVTLSKEI